MDRLEANSDTIRSGGWVLNRVTVHGPGSDAILTEGPAAESMPSGSHRGILAAVAHNADTTAEVATLGERPSLVALRGLVEGYYGARPTLGQSQALLQALNAINRWMFASRGMDATRPGLAASLSALVFAGRIAAILQIGGGMILRIRAGEVTHLTAPQFIRLAGQSLQLRRALGTDDRVLLDYQEEPVLADDRYILLSETRSPGALDGTIDGRALTELCRSYEMAGALAERLATLQPRGSLGEGSDPPPCRSVIVIDVTSLPEPTVAATEATLSDLPLGPVPQDGETLDGYLVGRTLHRGAYTLLKQAVDTRTKEAVVLKFPLPAMLSDRIFQAGFARESWIGTAIHSPVVGRVIPAEPGRRSCLYIVMPHYRGETLENRIAREPRFALQDIVSIGLQLCRAVEDLRAVQVLHRDLKPENVMLLNGGGLRLLDLGLAYLAGVDADTAHGLAGTIRYMAPELLRGAAAPDDRSEVYALGVILYRLAAYGRFPRPGTDIVYALGRQRPDLPPRLLQAIAAALDSDPAKRPAHAALFSRELSAALQEKAGGRLAGRRLALGRLFSPLAFWRGLAILLALALAASIALH
ncbi:MAG TPA: serine/threonine-protein kinase [Acidisoma sp.]|uniref:bifunctional protein-serine/threonine kinase/phosphatase n=1 Tax=Acidisoma sp. TaxID=1872115 RepID=UPI002C888AF3|nr:serine/threonine-protein kinase [Acidisoma sp.]HTI01621.1 serine/threonine-protein kinase [Acidisoma sp.]